MSSQERKPKSKIALLSIVIFAAIILLIGLYFLPHSRQKGPAIFQESHKLIEKTPTLPPEAGQAKRPAVITRESINSSEETDVAGNDLVSISQASANGSLPQELQNDFARLNAEPNELLIEVKEGQNAASSFNLTNTGNVRAYLNIYKIDLTEGSSIDEEMERFLNYKQSLFKGAVSTESLMSAGLSSGPAWIKQSPYYLILEPKKAASIQVAIFGRELEAKDYDGALLVVGINKDETLMVPVKARVKAGPKIRMVKLTVDDGTSKLTQGNADHCANPNEKISFTVYLQNQGNASAQGLTIIASSEDPVIIADNSQQGLSINSQETIPVTFNARVGKNAHPSIPPVIDLTITDSAGTQWEENFYLGEKNTFQYPTGVIFDEKLSNKTRIPLSGGRR